MDQFLVGFTGEEWLPSRLSFGKFKGRLYQESGNDGELKSWLEWLAAVGSVSQGIHRLLASGGEDVGEATAADYQREAAEKYRAGKS